MNELVYIAVPLVVIYFISLVVLISELKQNYHSVYKSFGGRRVWFSAPDQIKFFYFLFTLKYLALKSKKVLILSIIIKVLLISLAIAFITILKGMFTTNS